MEKLVKKFTLTVVSSLALGMAGAGFAQAGGTSNTTAMATNHSSASSTQTPSTMQQSETQTASVNLSKNQIQQVQEQLKTAGLYTGLYKGKADGKIGPETKQAIQQFQQQQGLQATGELDQQTMAALQGNQGSAGSSALPNGSRSNAGGLNNNLNNNQR
jgi:peptidoglycan hydrolase-like protein with peptidoglycan-binding domain